MRIYLLNNTKPYREGDEEYSGDWFDCPVDFEEIKEKLGVEHEEQLMIADYELPFHVNTDTSIWEVNENCRKVQEIEGTPVGNEIEAIQKKWFYSFEDFFENKEEIWYYVKKKYKLKVNFSSSIPFFHPANLSILSNSCLYTFSYSFGDRYPQ